MARETGVAVDTGYHTWSSLRITSISRYYVLEGGGGGGGVSGSERIKARFHSWSEVIEFLLHKFWVLTSYLVLWVHNTPHSFPPIMLDVFIYFYVTDMGTRSFHWGCIILREFARYHQECIIILHLMEDTVFKSVRAAREKFPSWSICPVSPLYLPPTHCFDCLQVMSTVIVHLNWHLLCQSSI